METLFEADDAVLKYDHQRRVFKFIWNGEVSFQTLKPLVEKACEITESVENASIIFDRRKLISYAPDARIWLKHSFMKSEGKRLMMKIKKIAALNSKSPFAQVISKVLVGALKFYNRKIQYKVFESEEEATNWIYANPVSMQAANKGKSWFSIFR